MRLSGWQRLWVLLTLVWTIVVATLTWTTWPPGYISVDPNVGIPIGADTALMLNGVISSDEKITPAEFAERLKAKYPEYKDLSDSDLVARVLAKYPHYRQYIAMPDYDAIARQFGGRNEDANAGEVNRANRDRAVRIAVALWLIPPIALYALGAGLGWVRRGFSRSEPEVAGNRHDKRSTSILPGGQSFTDRDRPRTLQQSIATLHWIHSKLDGLKIQKLTERKRAQLASRCLLAHHDRTQPSHRRAR